LSSDAEKPGAAPTFANGLLYGTPTQGGTGTCQDSTGCGTIFSVSHSGTETVLYAFTSKFGIPHSGTTLLAVGNQLYGDNPNGLHGCSFLYSITPQGTLTDLHDFAKNGSEGCGPSSPLLNVNGVLYGTMFGGGIEDGGAPYSFTP
jgi:uncharacterized repeat protein (TIGR03803 family)